MATGAVRVLRGLTFALGATLLAISLWVVIARFRHPVDGEWMTGAVRDGVERIRDGKQLYVAPTAEFIPFVYTPLYYWVSAFVARFVSTFVACKLVSIGATIAMGYGIVRIARHLGATPAWSRMTLILHVACYSLTILFYDIERVDAFYGAMIVIALAVLLSGEGARTTAIAGALFGLSFFAKQAGLVTFGAVVLGLLLARQRRRAAIALVSGAFVLLLVGAYLEVRTGGWFRYYCLKLPGAHGLRPQRLTLFFIEDVPKAFAFAAASVACSAPVLWKVLRGRRDEDAQPWRDVVFATILAGTMAAAFSFRAHSGGWPNVLVAWLPFGCAAFAVAATRAEERARGTTAAHVVSIGLFAAVSLQCLAAMFDPNELSPNADDLRERERFVALVRDLEREGDVLITTTGGVSKQTSAHVAALYDILRAGDHAPADLLQRLEERRFAAIFVGRPDELDCESPVCDELESAVVRNYFVAGRRHERERTGMTGYDARPRWLLRPRKHPLPHAPMSDLWRRQRIEKGFAEMKSARSPLDTEITPSDEIEDLAARELDR
ncbi:MAG: hypothetical protein KF819_26750 [Labilithrix sp.]|nr:hypothetical protein [Labilithrix sp.]